MLRFKVLGRNRKPALAEVEINGKGCDLKKLKVLVSAVNSLYDSTNFYFYSLDGLVTLENDRFLLRFLVPSSSSSETEKKVLLFAIREVPPIDMALYILENAEEIFVQTTSGGFKISPPDGGALVPYHTLVHSQ